MNHAFATSKGTLTPDKVAAVLHEVNIRRFNGFFTIIQQGHSWIIRHPDESKWQYLCSVWLETKRKVGFRRSLGDFAFWMQWVFQEEIAFTYKGRCSDEGVSEKWNPEPGKFPTFKAFWYEVRGPWKDETEIEVALRDHLWEKTKEHLPQELHQFI